MKLSSVLYIFRSRMVGSWAFVRYIGRGGINPFSAAGRQLYYYAFLRFVLQQGDRVEIPGTGSGQKRPVGGASQKKGGSFMDRQLSNVARVTSLGSIKSRLLGNETEAEVQDDPANRTFAPTSVQKTDQKIDLDRADQLSETLLEEEEKLPLLTSRRQIQGRRGRYRVTHYVSRRGLGRLYEGILVNDNKTVIIKEFLLPGHIFNEAEINAVKQEFEKLAGVNIAERTQDFRLLGAFEAIADDAENRCYLVTRGVENCNTSLREYLTQNGPMSDRQVHGVLNQVLQTLEFLHSHKFRLGNTSMQRGLTHRNIGLDSLLYKTCAKQELFSDQQFFIYVTDLGIWENLFRDPKETRWSKLSPDYQPQIDLADLGRLGFHLLVGRDRDENIGQRLDPRNSSLWPTGVDEPLKQFIFQLLGLNGSFNDVDEARLAFPPIPVARVSAPQSEPDSDKKSGGRWKKVLWIVGGVAAVGLLGGATWWGVSQYKQNRADQLLRDKQASAKCCIEKLVLPKGTYTYGSEENGLWQYILQHPGLISQSGTLEADLKNRAPKFKLKYQPEKSLEAVLAKVRTGAIDFAVTVLPASGAARSAVESEFTVQPIAYDGLAVFVAFSDVHRDRNIARSLDGQITFDRLRQIYTGKIQNWKELGGPDLKVKRYIPSDQKLLQIFETQIFGADEAGRSQFREQQNVMVRADATQTLRDVLNDFEDKNIGSIGFDSLSKVFGQCSVYPLGVKGAQGESVQPLVQDDGKSITPRSDLCDDKGSYGLDPNSFTQGSTYPLRYDLVVIYPKEGNAASPGPNFVDLWRTQEGQRLLSQTGLVPLLPLVKTDAAQTTR